MCDHQHLSSDVSVDSIVNKCNNMLIFMYRYSKSLNERSRILLTSALFQCNFNYAASAWYMGSTKALKDKLQVSQNKMVHLILDMGPKDHIRQNELDR